MGLVSSNICFFCLSRNPTWRHLLVCQKFGPMWETVKIIFRKAKCNWKQGVIFSGVTDTNFSALNHVINAAYSVIFESIACVLNKIPIKSDPSSKLRQKLFQLLYSNFKEICHDEVACSRFQVYWMKLNFLFEISWPSIDIRIPVYNLD